MPYSLGDENLKTLSLLTMHLYLIVAYMLLYNYSKCTYFPYGA
jgi:hypothetical protein